MATAPYATNCADVIAGIVLTTDNVLPAYLSWLKTNDSLGLEIPCNIAIVSAITVVSRYVVTGIVYIY